LHSEKLIKNIHRIFQGFKEGLIKPNLIIKTCFLVLFIFSSLIFSSSAAAANSIYIDYNASKDCMDSYEYAKNGNEEIPYLFFHFKVSDNEKIILEAGEDYTPRQYKPAGTITCAEFESNEKFVDDVNKGTLEVFLVREHTYGFRIYKVKKAEYYYNTNIAFGTRSDNYSFSYYYNQASTGNLATKGSKADIYFSGKDDNDCLSRYKFRVKTDPSRNTMTDLTILPEIGVLYKKSDPMPPSAVGEKLELRKINNYNILDYLGLICKFYGGQPKTNPGTTTNSNNPGDLSANRIDVPLNPSINSNPIIDTPNGGVSVTGGNSVGNGLLSGGSTSTVYPGAGRIYLDLDKGYYVDSTTGLRAEGEFGGNFYRNGYMVNNNTGTTTTVPSTGTNIPDVPTTAVNDDSGCLEVSTNYIHIVQKKETLYTIARTYGLDIKEVKKWNKIGPINRIYPCMRLAIAPPLEKPSKYNHISDCLEISTYDEHIVQYGESLVSIAGKYSVKLSTLLEKNYLASNDKIPPCTKLIIPRLQGFNTTNNNIRSKGYTTYFPTQIPEFNWKVELNVKEYFPHVNQWHELQKEIKEALENAGYSERFGILPLEQNSGFAIVTHPEFILNTGVPRNDRWAIKVPKNVDGDWWGNIKTLFIPRTGAFRSFVFVMSHRKNMVRPNSNSSMKEPLGFYDEILPQGTDSIDKTDLNRPVGSYMNCTIYIYEYYGVEGREPYSKPIDNSFLTGKVHLERSGILKF
jgi:LysM repeat protein